MIKTLTDREHILARSAMYIGATNLTTSSDYFVDGETMRYREASYVPGLIKIINEIIDNAVDEAIKTNFKNSNLICVKMDSNFVDISDNGRGIPVIKNADGEFTPMLCWNRARTGSNFDNDAERNQIGYNGVGSFATNCFSKKFVGKTDDGKLNYTITFKNNAEIFSESVSKSKGKTGTNVKFYPDLSKFGLTEIDKAHQDVIYQRLINLSMTFPEITFKFNGKKVNVNSFKKYVSMFSESFEIFETDNYKFAILPNESDDFRQFSYVNGLKIPDGGTHIDVITWGIVSRLRDKLARKFKSIKPGDIKNKLMVVAFLKNVKNTKFNSQSKEKITNSTADINKYYGDIPFDNIVNKLFRNTAIIDPITEVYRIKEELKRRQEMKGLKKSVKKIKSDKYLPSIGKKKYLLLCEGASAVGGLSPVLGRKECGYYELRGKPLNSYSAPQSKFTANKELSELYKIILHENYDYIVFANDADLDGMHIAGLLTGFFEKYLPEFKGRVARLLTPVKFVKKGDKPVTWAYSMNDELTPGRGEEFSYQKGLGSWDIDDLKFIINADGLENMIDVFDFDDKSIIDDWLGDDSEPRKKYILENKFSIARL